jgi:hypothetical protein
MVNNTVRAQELIMHFAHELDLLLRVLGAAELFAAFFGQVHEDCVAAGQGTRADDVFGLVDGTGQIVASDLLLDALVAEDVAARER